MTQALEPVLLREYRADVFAYMRGALCPPSTLAGSIIAYQLGLADRGGAAREAPSHNMIRPSLYLWAVGACGGDAAAFVPFAASMEMLHNFALIHDDIRCERQTRDGRETAWSVWGLGQGVNAGDALHSLALSVLSRETDREDLALGVFRRVVEAVNEGIDGSSRAHRTAGLPSGQYLRAALRKTGALVGISLEAGARAAGASGRRAVALRRAGRYLGVALQLHDDCDTRPAGSADLAERCRAGAVRLVAGCGFEPYWLQRFEEMAGYIAERAR